MGKSGIDWHMAYYVFIAIRVFVGLMNNESFQSWLLRFLIGTVILATIMAIDCDILKKE